MAQIELITFNNSLVTPQYDALLHDASVLSDGVFFGGEVTIKDSYTLHITKAIGMLQGREFILLEQDIDIRTAEAGSPGESQGSLYIEIDLDNDTTPIDLKVTVGDTPFTPQVYEDLNKDDAGVSQMVLATFTLNSLQLDTVTQVVQTIIKAVPASEISFNPVGTDIEANDVQGAIEDVYNMIGVFPSDYNAISANVATSTTVSKQVLTLPPGKWLVIGGAMFEENKTGTRWLRVSRGSASGSGSSYDSASCYASDKYQTILNASVITKISVDTPVYINVWQNSGSTLSVTFAAQAINLGI